MIMVAGWATGTVNFEVAEPLHLPLAADEHEVEQPATYVCTAGRLAAVPRGRGSGVKEADSSFDSL